ELFHADVCLVMLFQADAPVGHGNRVHSFTNLAVRAHLTPILITAKDVHSRIGRILENAQYAAMAQPAPYDPAVPRSTIRSFGKPQTSFTEPVDYCISTACL